LVQIRRLKFPLMTKVWLPKFWASTIPSIWTCGRPNSDKGARRYGPRNPYCAVSPKSEQIIFQGRFGDLIFVSKKSMNTKVGGNSVPYNQNTEFSLFWVQTWEIWCRQGRAVNQENLDEADFMETKFPSLPRNISCKERWSMPQGSPRA
jgi:hypothetical protein